MARPERNTVDYYPFFVGEGKKMFFIEKKYGNDGYATWIKIIDKLCTTEYHYLNLNSEEEIMFLAAKCNIDEDRLISIIGDISKLGKFDKELWSHRVVWCQDFINSIQDAYKKRNNNCITFDGLRLLLLSKGILNNGLSIEIDTDNTQSKVKKSKVKKSKETTSTETIVSDGIYPACMALYNAFIIDKTGVGAKINPATGSAMKKIIDYLKTQVKNKEDLMAEVPNAFEYVFKNFDRWDKFHKGQLNLNQIESNLINILNSIRNGKQQSSTKDVGQQYRKVNQ
jgi:hypothetical protein